MLIKDFTWQKIPAENSIQFVSPVLNSWSGIASVNAVELLNFPSGPSSLSFVYSCNA